MSVVLTRPGAYNNTAMRIAKYTYPTLALVFGVGLLYLQACGVICSVSNCSRPAPVRSAANAKHAGHCHQKRPSSQRKRSPDDSRDCPGHYSAVSIPPSETVSTVVSHLALQPAVAEPLSSFDVLFNLAGSRADRVSHFRSPPGRPQFTVLRI